MATNNNKYYGDGQLRVLVFSHSTLFLVYLISSNGTTMDRRFR